MDVGIAADADDDGDAVAVVQSGSLHGGGHLLDVDLWLTTKTTSIVEDFKEETGLYILKEMRCIGNVVLCYFLAFIFFQMLLVT
jgi:hypothetical protein